LQVLSYKDAIKDLENAGEINVKISMHTFEKTEGSNDFCFKAQKKVCFVLDQPKESKKKKAH
jgi:aspartyl/asparaginyl-tRNA synthetase